MKVEVVGTNYEGSAMEELRVVESVKVRFYEGESELQSVTIGEGMYFDTVPLRMSSAGHYFKGWKVKEESGELADDLYDTSKAFVIDEYVVTEDGKKVLRLYAYYETTE